MEKPNKQEKLHHSYNHKQSNPKTISRCRSLTDSRTTLKSLHLLDHSPRNLMYSLQHKRSPSDGVGAWKVRNNDFAVEEILRERREAIESGKLKGRKLFDTADDTAEIGFSGWEIDGEVDDEVRSIFYYDSDDEKENVIENLNCSPSFSSSSSYVCDECMEKEIVSVEGEKEVSVEKGKVEDEDEEEKGSVINGGKVKGWVAIGISFCVIGMISVWRFGSYGDRSDEVMFLVPT